jgi:hypothetical protein
MISAGKVEKRKAAAFARCTSRMMREYQVRICERLGMKLPGPTRHLDSRQPTPDPIFNETFAY